MSFHLLTTHLPTNQPTRAQEATEFRLRPVNHKLWLSTPVKHSDTLKKLLQRTLAVFSEVTTQSVDDQGVQTCTLCKAVHGLVNLKPICRLWQSMIGNIHWVGVTDSLSQHAATPRSACCHPESACCHPEVMDSAQPELCHWMSLTPVTMK